MWLRAGDQAVFPPAARATACYGAPVSIGWLAGLAGEAAVGLSGFLEWFKANLTAADVLHADETSARVSGAVFWFHVACDDLLTFLGCHEHRGAEAPEDIAIVPRFRGVLVTDGWKPYWNSRDLVEQGSAYACHLHANARPPRRTASTCRSPRTRSSAATRAAPPCHGMPCAALTRPRETLPRNSHLRRPPEQKTAGQAPAPLHEVRP
jgi:hypothetical protein